MTQLEYKGKRERILVNSLYLIILAYDLSMSTLQRDIARTRERKNGEKKNKNHIYQKSIFTKSVLEILKLMDFKSTVIFRVLKCP